MDVNELMNLKRPLTDDEMDFMEQELLKLAQQLKAEVGEVTKDLDPSNPEVARLREGAPKIARSIQLARKLRTGAAVETRQARRRKLRRSANAQPEVVFSWEKLPVYKWNSEFARGIGRLLATVPARLHIMIHNLAGQATVIANCIVMIHRDKAPHEIVPAEELRAWRSIGHVATCTVLDMLHEISESTRHGAADIAHMRTLVEEIGKHFEMDGAEAEQRPRLLN